MPLFPQGGGLYPDSIDNSLLADMAANTVKGRAAGSGTGNPQDLPMSSLIAASAGLSYRNILGRNGGMEVWQRGAGGSASIAIAGNAVGGYTADGWWLINTGAVEAHTVSQQAGLTAGSRYCARVQRNAGQTGVAACTFEFPLDADELASMRGSFVTLSMWLRAGANWSPSGGFVQVYLFTGTGAVTKASAGFTGTVLPINNVPLALTATATAFSVTSSIVVPANTAQASVVITYTPIGTAGAADYFEIDDVQLEIGSVATPFERRPFESELRACQRHFWRFESPAAGYYNFGMGQCYDAASAIIPFQHPVLMRAAPTPSVGPTNASFVLSLANFGRNSCTGLAIYHNSPFRSEIQATCSGGLGGAGTVTMLSANNVAGAYIQFSAEI